ncbi:hypothetical protein ACHHV8_15260 [Paenibacillus sp. TAB 01]
MKFTSDGMAALYQLGQRFRAAISFCKTAFFGRCTQLSGGLKRL